jgi:hypothetical protein
VSSSHDESRVRLKQGGTNPYGSTFWSLSFDNRFDGRAKGGIHFEVDIHTQAEGLRIAGELITWDVLLKAKEYADSKATKK